MPKPRTPAPSPSPVSTSFVAPEELERLLSVMVRHDVTEFEHVRGDQRLTLKRGSAHTVVTHAAPPPVVGHAAPLLAPAAPVAPKVEDDAGVQFVTSPLVGTFYRAPSPDAPSFVDVGTRVKKGQRLCIVEAMKLMNEIESEVEGVVLEILVENGKPVEYGQKIFKVSR